MDLFETIFDPCSDGEHMLEYHKVDKFTGIIYDYCARCEHMVPRQVAE